MKNKKKLIRNMFLAFTILLFSVVLLPVGNITATHAASKATLKSKLESATPVPIRKFIFADLNKDGQKEAIAMTSKSVDELGYVDASFWYITNQSCEKIGSSDGMCVYPASIKKYNVKNTWIVTFEAGAGGSGWYTYAYAFDSYGAHEVDNIGVGLTYLGKNKFVVLDSRYDASTDETGHTWNKYYSKWDGEKLVEYGGLSISQKQLKKAKNGTTIIKQIRKTGNIGTIYYRANGLIFVNYTSGGSNYNVTLKLKNGKLSYQKQNDYGKTKLEKATSAGVIHQSITKCVVYPKKFPVE